MLNIQISLVIWNKCITFASQLENKFNLIHFNMFGKGSKYSFNGDGNLDCEFLTSTFEDGYPYSVGLVNHFKKEVSPVHGYYYPNKTAKHLMNYALKLGYTYVDSSMPDKLNKTLKTN